MLSYDGIYKITRDTSNLILWLQEKGINGNVELIVCSVWRVESILKKVSETALFVGALKRNVGIIFHWEQVAGSRTPIKPYSK